MRRSLPLLTLFSILAIAFSTDKTPTCGLIDGYNVCHYKGVLVDVTQRLQEDRLDLSDLDLLAIRENAFKNLTATHLYLNQGNRISVVKRGSFLGLSRLERLHLDGNVIPLSPNLFAELDRLESLSLVYNKINAVPKDSFAGMPKLMWLYLGHNDIPSIEVDSFSGLTSELLYLWLNNNNISSIKPEAFAHLRELNRLHLDYNELVALERGTFHGLQKLEFLFLNDNRLTSIAKDSFDGLRDLRRLYLYSNEIASVEPGAFRNLHVLEVLRLDGNKLVRIAANTFRLGNLKELRLSNNSIETVESNGFSGMEKAQSVYLGKNPITSVDNADVGLSPLTMVYFGL